MRIKDKSVLAGVSSQMRVSGFLAISAWIFLISAGCVNTPPSKHLSQRAAVEIADEEVFRVTKSDLRQFDRPETKYIEGEKCWYVNYRLRNHTEAELSVQVDEQTRTAVVRTP